MKHIKKLLDTRVENDDNNSNSRGNKIGTLKDYCEIGMEHESLSYPNQRIPTVYSEAKK